MLYRLKSIALFGALLFAAAFLAAASRSSGKAGQQDDEIPAPAYWVAFDADVRETQAGAPEFTGRFYRDSDGSTRQDMHSADGLYQLLLIVNVASNTSFTCEERPNKWSSRPAGFDSHTKPVQRYRRSSGLAPLSDPLEGLLVYRKVYPDGRIETLAPNLNFLAILVEDTSRRRRRSFSNIHLGEPEPALFAPPPGAVIVTKKQIDVSLRKPRRNEGGRP
jgi:hypothetical protein